jgi:hypothetical protein
MQTLCESDPSAGRAAGDRKRENVESAIATFRFPLATRV